MFFFKGLFHDGAVVASGHQGIIDRLNEEPGLLAEKQMQPEFENPFGVFLRPYVGFRHHKEFHLGTME